MLVYVALVDWFVLLVGVYYFVAPTALLRLIANVYLLK